MAAAPFPPNVRRFIGFRVLFNARFYYPVIAILFLDLGLTMQQYAWLNAVWAAAIVLCEVPSGALADRFGRKRLLLFSGALMVAEMLLLALAPGHPGPLLLGCVILNRICSGVAEASASGADEALAYDSLAAAGRADEWPSVLSQVMRWQSIAFVCTSVIGAAIYDAHLVNKAAEWVGWDARFDQSETARFPILLNLITAAGTLALAVGMREAPRTGSPAAHSTWRLMAAAARWILGHRFFLVLILSAVCFDSFVRLFLTVGSSYYRLIGIPEALYGFIGTGFALLGFLVPQLATRMAARNSPGRNLFLTACLALAGLCAVAAAWRGYGVLAVIPLGIAFFLQSFFLSHHLNRGVDSSMRATVLSFKGLAMNVAYGGAGLLFSALVAIAAARDPASGADGAFHHALLWLPPLFVIALLPLAPRWRNLREAA